MSIPINSAFPSTSRYTQYISCNTHTPSHLMLTTLLADTCHSCQSSVTLHLTLHLMYALATCSPAFTSPTSAPPKWTLHIIRNSPTRYMHTGKLCAWICSCISTFVINKLTLSLKQSSCPACHGSRTLS